MRPAALAAVLAAACLPRPSESEARAPEPTAPSPEPVEPRARPELLDGEPAPPGTDELVVEELALPGFDGAPARALLVYPGAARAARAVPAVVALHGRGESLRGPGRGHRGWLDDYALADAYRALRRGRPSREDYRGFVDDSRLAEVEARLARAPLGPLATVLPYLPDLAGEPPGSPALSRYGAWLAGPLLEAARARLPALSSRREELGVDGVSLGGMVALEAGFAHPEVFGRVGAIQPAVTGREERLARAAARPGAPAQRVRLLSSRGDPVLAATRGLAAALRGRGVEVELVVLPGPHDYSFNRGPGSLELLLFHGLGPGRADGPAGRGLTPRAGAS